jgi:hypothetical protein
MKGQGDLSHDTSLDHGNRSTYNNHGCRCKPCTDDKKRGQRRWYADNVERVKARERRRRQVWQERTNAIKADGCTDCDAIAEDFDHVPERGAKDFKIADGYLFSKERQDAELAKCDPVCKPCHRVRTRERLEAT